MQAYIRYFMPKFKDNALCFQKEYYLPYSKSEDVDFTIYRPEGFGCFKWSVPDTYAYLVRLETHVTDKTLRCGNEVLIQIIAEKSIEKNVNIVLTGENVGDNERYNKDTKKDMKLPTGNLKFKCSTSNIVCFIKSFRYYQSVFELLIYFRCS